MPASAGQANVPAGRILGDFSNEETVLEESTRLD